MAAQSTEHEAIVALVDREVDAMRRGDIGQVATLLSDDAILFAPSVLPKTGAELRRWLGDLVATLSWSELGHSEQ